MKSCATADWPVDSDTVIAFDSIDGDDRDDAVVNADDSCCVYFKRQAYVSISKTETKIKEKKTRRQKMKGIRLVIQN